MLNSESGGATDKRDTEDNLSEGLLCGGASCSAKSVQCVYFGSCIMLFLPPDADLLPLKYEKLYISEFTLVVTATHRLMYVFSNHRRTSLMTNKYYVSSLFIYSHNSTTQN